ncbi:hypothetical protein GCM10011352_08020 [Marinobacterium zhoushanense]|uniref:ABC transporter permease n=1 Tax=Marinobacterium zhoushanense TaxID=1679163 RepID=A0ABQ1K591_9GAMM|nr:hypothetical protein [Marinobacterium zhoushanense]GGB84565.1 hypothetical protein GCM10011352_08020 [Marinobacterium zhoushanense]
MKPILQYITRLGQRTPGGIALLVGAQLLVIVEILLTRGNRVEALL